ncbi:MAG: class I adenylate-forming enzyme family protein [Deltaproteobacteria bacterium]
MRALGISRGALVALNTSDMTISLAVLLATSLLGARFVVASRLLANSPGLEPTHFLRSPEAVGSKRVHFVEIDRTWQPHPGEDPDVATFDGFADDTAPWMYLHTSGSTGTPKYLSLSERVVFDRTVAIKGDFKFGQTTVASLFGATMRPFFARALGTLMNAGALVDSKDITVWQRTGVNLVFASPEQLVTFLGDRVIAPKIQRVEVSGAKLEVGIARLLLQSFETVTDVYGAGETNKTFATRFTLQHDGSLRRKGERLDSEIEIVKPDGTPCANDEVGSVRVRNRYLVDGYLDNPEATTKAFRNGWFYPGDLANWGPSGELLVIGRDDDIINLGGYKVPGLMIDFTLLTVPGVKDAACFKNPKPHAMAELLAFIVFDDLVDRKDVAEAAKRACESRLGISLAPRNIRAIDKIPRAPNGAPMRDICAQLLLEKYNEQA